MKIEDEVYLYVFLSLRLDQDNMIKQDVVYYNSIASAIIVLLHFMGTALNVSTTSKEIIIFYYDGAMHIILYFIKVYALT